MRHRPFFLLPAALALAGCSQLHRAQLDEIDTQHGFLRPGPPRLAERIEAQTWQHVILGITDNTDYVDKAYASLLSQCPGEIVGLNTRYSTSLGFLSYKNVVEMRAMCLRDPPSAGPGPADVPGP